MNLTPLKTNMTEIKTNDYVILFSYKTPVAYVDRKTGKIYRTEKYWSKTTSRHINKWLKEWYALESDNCEEVAQTVLDGLV